MKRTVLAASIILALAFCASAQQVHPAASTEARSGKKPALQAKIEQAWVGWVKKDRPSIDKLLADDAVEIWADGQGFRDKQSTLAGMEAMNIGKYSLSDFKFAPVGDKAQLAMYHVTLEFKSDGPMQQWKIAVSEVWLKRGKEWKLLHYQETQIK